MNIIRQDASGMRIYRSDKPFPVQSMYPTGAMLRKFTQHWFTSAESIPVHSDEVERFIDYTLRLVPYLKTPAECWAEGIPIPDDCFYLDSVITDFPDSTTFAYFKEPAKEKDTPEPILFGMFLTGRDRESVERDFELWKNLNL